MAMMQMSRIPGRRQPGRRFAWALVLALAFVDSHTNGPLIEAGKAFGPWHGIRIVYRVEVTGGDLRDEIDESTDAAAWFARGEAAQLPRTELVDAALEFLDANLE